LKVNTQILDDHQAKITVELEPETFEKAKHQAARRVAKRMKIPGFRPGKAPYQVILRYAGEATIVDEGLEILVHDNYPSIIDEAKIEPYGPGTLENVIDLDPPTLEFIVPLEAEVELGDYKSLRFPYEPESVTDEEVNTVLDNLREQEAIIEPVERKVLEGDVVTAKIKAVVQKGDKENEEETIINERSIPFVVLEGDTENVDEWPFSGFSQKLIGLEVGDEKTFTFSYPDDYSNETMKGKNVEFHVVVELVRSRTLPDLDDNFASTIGEYETLEDLREDISTTLEARKLASYNEEYDETILKNVIEISTIKFPPQMLESQIDSVLNNYRADLEQQNLDLDLYLKSRSMSLDEFKEEITPIAEERLKRTLVLMEIANAENIQIEPDELQTETMSALQAIAQQDKLEDLKISEAQITSLSQNVYASLLANKALLQLRDICQGKLESDEEQALETDAEEDLEYIEEAQVVNITNESAGDDDNEPEIVENLEETETIDEQAIED